MRRIWQIFTEYFRALAEVFFFKEAPVGIGLLVLIAAFHPFAFACSFFASMIGYLHTVRYSTPKAITSAGLLPVNGFFFGLAMCYLFEPSLQFYVYLTLGALALPVVTKAMFEVLQHWRLSPLIAPYVGCTWLFWLSRERLGLNVSSHAAPNLLAVPYTEFVSEPLLSAGRLLFLPNVGFGLLLLTLVLAFEFRRGFYFLLGSVAASGVAYFLAWPGREFSFGGLTYSGGLIALALAAFPEKFKLHNIAFFAALSTLVTLACEEFLSRQDLPVLTLPLALTIWLAQLSRIPRLNVSWAPENIHRRQTRGSDPIFTGERAI